MMITDPQNLSKYVFSIMNLDGNEVSLTSCALRQRRGAHILSLELVARHNEEVVCWCWKLRNSSTEGGAIEHGTFSAQFESRAPTENLSCPSLVVASNCIPGMNYDADFVKE